MALVDWRGGYDCIVSSYPSGYDWVCPSAQGEYQLARAYSRTLHDVYGVGDSVPDVPADLLVRPLEVPSNVIASGAGTGVTVVWDPVYGALG